MHYSSSQSFFEISNGPQLENTLEARLVCLKDFLKRCAVFPLALVAKAFTTFWRGIGVCFGALLIVVTVASSSGAREFFVERIAIFAKDLADWLLLPFALIVCFFRLILAFIVHPNLYFTSS
jgi:hypothetical protein